MAALTTDKIFNFKAAHRAIRLGGPVAADVRIFQGALLGLNSGKVRPLVAGDVFLGRAVRQVDNLGGAADAEVVERAVCELLDVAIAGTTAADTGARVYASNDNDLTLTKSTNSLVGLLEEHIGGTRFWMRTLTPGESAELLRLDTAIAAAAAA